MPIQPVILAFSFAIKIANKIVTTGEREIKGKTKYAGAILSVLKRSNCPPAPKNPAAEPSKIERLLYSGFQSIFFNANKAGISIVNAQTQ